VDVHRRGDARERASAGGLGGAELRRVRRQSEAAASDGAKTRERGRRYGVVLAARRGLAGKQRGPRVKELRHVRRDASAGVELRTGGSVQTRARLWRCCSVTVRGEPALEAVESHGEDVGGC
jgi:hypothetical protein